MRLTHFGHSCVLVETGDAQLLIDPGAFSEGFERLEQLDAVLITHKDFDHFVPDTIDALMRANTQATLVVEPATADEVPESVDAARRQVVSSGETFSIADVEIQTVGGRHATIHPEVERIPNVGFYFPASGLLHPGDEFVQPSANVEILALPISGPWLSLADAVEYLRAIDPAVAFPIHEALHSRPAVYYKYVDALKPPQTSFQILEHSSPTEL